MRYHCKFLPFLALRNFLGFSLIFYSVLLVQDQHIMQCCPKEAVAAVLRRL